MKVDRSGIFALCHPLLMLAGSPPFEAKCGRSYGEAYVRTSSTSSDDRCGDDSPELEKRAL